MQMVSSRRNQNIQPKGKKNQVGYETVPKYLKGCHVEKLLVLIIVSPEGSYRMNRQHFKAQRQEELSEHYKLTYYIRQRIFHEWNCESRGRMSMSLKYYKVDFAVLGKN